MDQSNSATFTVHFAKNEAPRIIWDSSKLVLDLILVDIGQGLLREPELGQESLKMVW